MISLIHDYPSEFEPRLNSGLMTKDFDAPLVDYIVDSWRSLEVVPNIKFIGYEFDTNEYDIDVNRYIFKREKKKKKKDKKDYKFIADDRFGKLTVHLEVHLMEKNEHTGEMYKHVYPVKKEMLIPIQDEKGYYYIHGKKYYLIYQMVEKSTYTSNQSVTLKSLMPVAVKRGILESTGINEIEVKDNTDDTPLTDEKMESDNVSIEDCYGKQYTLPYYNVFVFKKEVPVILFYLKDGFNSAMDFLGVSGVDHFSYPQVVSWSAGVIQVAPPNSIDGRGHPTSRIFTPIAIRMRPPMSSGFISFLMGLPKWRPK